MIALPAGLTLADIAAVALHVAACSVMGWLIEHPPRRYPSVSAGMRAYRVAWMEQLATREGRVFDSSILTVLHQSAAFFISACMIAIGGGLALLGQADTAVRAAEGTPLASISILAWRIKIVLALVLVVNAFLKFVWAHRLYAYCAIIMASIPMDPDNPHSHPRALKAAEVNTNAARNYNAGLRTVYFAISSLAWIAGPTALTAATVVVVYSTWRREFASASRIAILADD